MSVKMVTGTDNLPGWVNRDELSDNGSGKEYASYLLIEYGGRRVCYSDAMEPEDARFFRDLAWVKTEIEKALAWSGEG